VVTVSAPRVVHDHFGDTRFGCVACDFPVGAGVVYRPHPSARAEDGTVVGANGPACLVYVLYAGDRTAKATPAEALTLTGGAR
jgi:hypothetical protein